MNREAQAVSRNLRLFVAIPLPAPIREALQVVPTQLRRSLPKASISWTRAENLHLTLRFLGKVPVARLDELQAKLRAALDGFGPLELLCSGLGCFPDSRFPRVLWASVQDAGDRLPGLPRRVDEAVREFSERPTEAHFVGHVTLARPKKIQRTEAERLSRFLAGAVDRPFGHWPCAEVELVASELSASGSRYATLDVIPL